MRKVPSSRFLCSSNEIMKTEDVSMIFTMNVFCPTFGYFSNQVHFFLSSSYYIVSLHGGRRTEKAVRLLIVWPSRSGRKSVLIVFLQYLIK